MLQYISYPSPVGYKTISPRCILNNNVLPAVASLTFATRSVYKSMNNNKTQFDN